MGQGRWKGVAEDDGCDVDDDVNDNIVAITIQNGQGPNRILIKLNKHEQKWGGGWETGRMGCGWMEVAGVEAWEVQFGGGIEFGE